MFLSLGKALSADWSTTLSDWIVDLDMFDSQ